MSDGGCTRRRRSGMQRRFWMANCLTRRPANLMARLWRVAVSSLPTAKTDVEKLRKAREEVVRELDKQESARAALLNHLRDLERMIAEVRPDTPRPTEPTPHR